MQSTTQNNHAFQSNSFFKLRHKMQNQMKKTDMSYENINKIIKEIKIIK